MTSHISPILRETVLRRSRPLWLWYTLHAAHIPWVRAVGVAWAPHAYLSETRRAASGLLRDDTQRAILRVQVDLLDPFKLRHEQSWEDWRKERQGAACIDDHLYAYLQYLQPKLPGLRTASLRSALRPALGRVQSLWCYSGIIPQKALALKAEDSDFYLSLA